MTTWAQKLIQTKFWGQTLPIFQHSHVAGLVCPFLPRTLLCGFSSVLFPQCSLGWIIPTLFFSFVFSVCAVRLSSIALRNLSQYCLISFVFFCAFYAPRPICLLLAFLYHISHCLFICHMVHVMTAHLSASEKMHV